jgi:hypothetical protein
MRETLTNKKEQEGEVLLEKEFTKKKKRKSS